MKVLIFFLSFSLMAQDCTTLMRHLVNFSLSSQEIKAVSQNFTPAQRTVFFVLYPSMQKKFKQELVPFCLEHKCSLHDPLARKKIIQKVVAETVGQVQKLKAYSGIIAIMASVAFANTLITKNLPDDLTFLSHFLAQVTAIGVFIIGAPIWEPLSSRFRQWAFKTKQTISVETPPLIAASLEETWHRTQEHLSLNAQMSRSVIDSYFKVAMHNFIDIASNLKVDDYSQAARNLSVALIHLKDLYPEIALDSSLVIKRFQGVVGPIEDKKKLMHETLEIISRTEPQYKDEIDKALEIWMQELAPASKQGD